MEKEFYFLKDTTGYLMDEIPSSKVDEHFFERGWSVETILAEHRWQAHRSAEMWNCELLHLITGHYCTCGEHEW